VNRLVPDHEVTVESGAARRNRPFAVASIHPDDLVPPSFDVIEVLEREGEKYVGYEKMDIRGVPTYIVTALNRFREWGEEYHTRPDKGATLACCGIHGLHVLESSEMFQRWKKLHHEAQLLSELSARAQVRIDRELRDYVFEVGDPIYGKTMNRGRKTERLQFRCNENCKKELFGVASNVLGMYGANLTLVCILEGLRKQPGVHRDFAEWMSEAFQRFQEELGHRCQELADTLEVVQRSRVVA
jgi:hypothetical protein